jgi:MazG family protein
MNENENGRWGEQLHRIWEIIDRLRGEGGCPWDRKQTPETVQTYLMEEAHEAAAAVRSGRTAEAAEELGDLLFMVFFLTHLYEEQGSFRLDDVCDLICSKMIRRHPHVFGGVDVRSVQDVKDNWEKIKAAEKGASGKSAGGIPDSLPALIRAHRMISRLAQGKNDDWSDPEKQAQNLAALSEDLVSRLSTGAPTVPEALGELLLAVVNVARIEGYRAEDCLHATLRSLEEPH